MEMREEYLDMFFIMYTNKNKNKTSIFILWPIDMYWPELLIVSQMEEFRKKLTCS
jgi:hypothetical protein